MLGNLTKLNLKFPALAALLVAGALFVSACIVIDTGPGETDYSVGDFEIVGYREHTLSSIRNEGFDPYELSPSQYNELRMRLVGVTSQLAELAAMADEAEWEDASSSFSVGFEPGVLPYEVYARGMYIGDSNDVLTKLNQTSAVNLLRAVAIEINRVYLSLP